MSLFQGIALTVAALPLMTTVALADKFDACPDPDTARKWVRACMQENPYNTKESCEERALARFCSGQ